MAAIINSFERKESKESVDTHKSADFPIIDTVEGKDSDEIGNYQEMVRKIDLVFPDLGKKLKEFKKISALPKELAEASIDAFTKIVLKEPEYEAMLKNYESSVNDMHNMQPTFQNGEGSYQFFSHHFLLFLKSDAIKRRFFSEELKRDQLYGKILNEYFDIVNENRDSLNLHGFIYSAMNSGVLPNLVAGFLKLQEKLPLETDLSGKKYGCQDINVLLNASLDRIHELLKLDDSVFKTKNPYTPVQIALLLDLDLNLPVDIIKKFQISWYGNLTETCSKIKENFKKIFQSEGSREKGLLKLQNYLSLIKEDDPNIFKEFGISLEEILEEGFMEESSDLHAYVMYATPYLWKEIRELHYSQLLALAQYGVRKTDEDPGMVRIPEDDLSLFAQKQLTIKDIDNDWWTPKHTEALRVLHYDMIKGKDPKQIDELLYTPCRKQQQTHKKEMSQCAERHLLLSSPGSAAGLHSVGSSAAKGKVFPSRKFG